MPPLPDNMDPNLISVGEMSMREQFYVEQLVLLPLISITQFRTYKEGIIQAITQQLDASFVDINGHNTSPNHSLEWTNQQAPGALDSWNNWITHSNEITSMPPFLIPQSSVQLLLLWWDL